MLRCRAATPAFDNGLWSLCLTFILRIWSPLVVLVPLVLLVLLYCAMDGSTQVCIFSLCLVLIRLGERTVVCMGP